jgi:hypothetical protein
MAQTLQCLQIFKKKVTIPKKMLFMDLANKKR